MIGKDITRFHAVVWPAMLMSAGVDLPRQIFGHGFVYLKGQKMSKSLGTILDPLEAADRFGADPLRLYLVKEIAYGADGDFSWERFEERYNVDLANNLGNLVNRVAAMADRYRGGRLQPGGATAGRLAAVAGAGRRRLPAEHGRPGAARGRRRGLPDRGRGQRVHRRDRALGAGPRPRAGRPPHPGALRRDRGGADRGDPARADHAGLVRRDPAAGRRAARTDGPSLDRDAAWRPAADRAVAKADPLWPRLEAAPTAPSEPAATAAASTRRAKPMTDEQKEQPAAPPAPPATPSAAPAAPAAGERITIDDFMKVELRVAKVLAAERVPKSRKLIKLQVDVGTEQRTLVAGIAEAYEAESLVGRTVAIVFNLKPTTLMGIESNGMVLAASPEGGKPSLVTFEEPGPPPGSRVR